MWLIGRLTAPQSREGKEEIKSAGGRPGGPVVETWCFQSRVQV